MEIQFLQRARGHHPPDSQHPARLFRAAGHRSGRLRALSWRSARRLRTVSAGLDALADGQPVRLPTEGFTAELAEKLAVSAKAISKWETGRGLPDISLLEPLAAALGVSVLELMQGEAVVNRNRSANLLRSKLYVCPLCGNVLHATGQAVVSCCGITLPPLNISEADDADAVSYTHLTLPTKLEV